ncbi:hypothetical protein [Neolewinella antarctica]|uniref:Uncharacterized protein n=1 Tax=Neolewinella antarctica TaxID=442734 RepID=A0ABX0XAN0_9BACT|nr:hypothetical protein [Neolewinella antarctica]NJC26277.1 hypothetical protein [Neolewinella antarctica]
MDDRLLDKIAEPFNLKLPEYTSMHEMIEEILPAVRSFSEPELAAEDSPLYENNWVRMTDNPGDTIVQLHRFNRGGEIQIANDGAMDSLSHQIVSPKRIIIGQSLYRDSFLYELAFLDNDFLILKRHGNEANFTNKYLFYAVEHIGSRLTWDEALEKIVAKYRDNSMPWWLILVVLLLVGGAVIYLS